MSLSDSLRGTELQNQDQKMIPRRKIGAEVIDLDTFRLRARPELARFYDQIEDLKSHLEDLPYNGKKVSAEIALLLHGANESGSINNVADLQPLLYDTNGELWLRPLFGYLPPNTQVQLRYTSSNNTGHMHAYKCEGFGIELAHCDTTKQPDTHDFKDLLRLGYTMGTPIQFGEQSQVDLTTETGLATVDNLQKTVAGLAKMIQLYGQTDAWDTIEEAVSY